MRIIEIELYRYRRFNLNKIERFYYKIGQKTQVILGTNGSGKSSLLSELSPLPSKSKNFYDGGYKRIVVENNGSMYELTSDWNNKHSCIKDGIELNDGHTLTAQKQIVYNEFRLDDKLFNILSGKINFCDMNIGDRRKWFTHLSDNDYDYVGAVYDKIKDKHNSLQSDIKSVLIFKEKELKNELSLEEVESVRDSITIYKECIDKLNGIKQNISRDEYEINSRIARLDSEIEKRLDIIKRYKKELNYYLYSRIDSFSIDDDYTKASNELMYNEGRLENLISQFDNIKYQISTLEDKQSKDAVDSRIRDIDNEINGTTIDIENISELYHCLTATKENIQNAIMALPSNDDKKYSKSNLDIVESKLGELAGTIFSNKKEEERLVQIILGQETSLKADGVTCPKCNYEWKIGYNETLHKDSINSLNAVRETIGQLEKEREDYLKKKESINEYIDLYRKVLQFFRYYPVLNYVWEKIKDYVSMSPDRAIQEIDNIYVNITRQYKVYTLIKEKNDLIKTREMSINNPDDVKKELMDKKDSIEKTIEELSIRNMSLKKLLSIYTSQIEIRNKIVAENNNLNKLVDEIKSNIDDRVKSAVNDKINEVLKDILTKMLDSQNTLSDNEKCHLRLKELERQEKEYRESIEAIKLLENVLSPKSGIIADSLIGFINTILEYINKFVSDVWTYKIEIIPVEIEDKDILDYKFRVRINDYEVIDDISEASNGLKEIINLGFKICVMSYLDFKGYPIYLDEFGSTFDKQHRVNTSIIINDLVNDDMFSNIFMVSHYEESYGSMRNTDVIVMHDENISIPDGSLFNQNVLIETS
jgi:DNA repair exonuclease SbcCD ATPase subunit